MHDNFTESHHDADVHDTCDETVRSAQALRDAALLAGPQRHAFLQAHPLHAVIIEIKTPPIREALLLIHEAIKFRRPGLAFLADCRHGKTTMLTMVSRAMGAMFSHVPYRIITAARHDKATEKATWTDVLDGFDIQCGGTAVQRKKAAYAGILSACLAANGDTFVLYIDEGQNWSELEFNFLRDFTNELRQYSQKTLITITVGDPKLKKVSDSLKVSDKGLWSRFLRTVRVFSGIKTQEELQKVLNEYDSAISCEYPKGSGVAYSEFFLPHAYAAGWRLAHEASPLWNALMAVAETHHAKQIDVGMQWIAESVLTVLTVGMTHDHPGYRPDPFLWESAVSSSQFETTFL